MLLQNLYVPFSINCAITDVQITNAMGTSTPPYHHRCWLLNFALIKIQIVLFLFGLEDMMSMISKNSLKFGLHRSQHTSICVSPSPMSLGRDKLAAFPGVVYKWLCMVEFYIFCGTCLDV
ncbi:hypothetical protein XENOCAPTIV_001497 [Xenoophorus captivus]|uniref:Uncharacterized protein n=1 Tax=Xenoophorus captivus TaxID=1517983 RepID=A0ABV0S6T4_9TELE